MIPLSYFLLFVVLLSILLWMVNLSMKKLGRSPKNRQRAMGIILATLFGWLAIQFAIDQTGFYLSSALPPRIPLLMILPVFLFTGIFLFWKRNSEVLHAIPIYIPIAYQSFRAVIEVLFYFTFLQGILPIQVTFEGANYDVLLGISAIVMGFYAYRSSASKKILIAWNFLGIGVILFAAFTFVTSLYFPEFWGTGGFSDRFIHFPFLLLPSFFMPSAIFMHVLSIVQLSKQLKLETGGA